MNSTSTPSPAVLAKFEDAMRGVIGLLDDPQVDVSVLEQAVGRLTRRFDELRATTCASSTPRARAQSDSELACAAALNAVAQQLVSRQLQLTAEHIALTRQLQQALDRSCAADNTGAYCDVER